MSKITESARGQQCQVNIPGVCSGNPETVVWAHANGLQFGKGIGMKSPDALGSYASHAMTHMTEGSELITTGSLSNTVLWKAI